MTFPHTCTTLSLSVQCFYMSKLPQSIERAITAFASLPGVGNKTAQRFAFYVLRRDQHFARELGDAIIDLKQKIGMCHECCNMADGGVDRCGICADSSRD